jgi:hypothetical protein
MQTTVTGLKFTKTAFQVIQLTKLQVSPVVLQQQQQQLIAPAVDAAKSSGLQQHAARFAAAGCSV